MGTGAGKTASVRASDGSTVAEMCRLADTPMTRLRGLIGRAPLQPGEGLLLRPTAAVHTCFLRHPIDAVFLDRDLAVVGVAARMQPWRLAGRRRARAVLELAGGESERRGIEVGTRLSVEGADGVA
jgi:uncharacterized membrane protein (UPF0127 family)